MNQNAWEPVARLLIIKDDHGLRFALTQNHHSFWDLIYIIWNLFPFNSFIYTVVPMLDIYLSMSLRRKNYAGLSKGPRVPNSFPLWQWWAKMRLADSAVAPMRASFAPQGGNWKRNGTLSLQVLFQRWNTMSAYVLVLSHLLCKESGKWLL